jgi:hypothetical protein
MMQRNTHFGLFMNNSDRMLILTAAGVAVIAGFRESHGARLGIPRLARLCGASVDAIGERFPQFLWIEVCISCKLSR